MNTFLLDLGCNIADVINGCIVDLVLLPILHLFTPLFIVGGVVLFIIWLLLMYSPRTKEMKRFPEKVAERDYDPSLREEIQDGDLLLCSGGYGWTSRLIERLTNSCWSHVAFLLKLPNIDRVMVLESVDGAGVRTVPLHEYVKNLEGTGCGYKGRLFIARHKEMKSKMTEESLKKMSQFAIDKFSHPYSMIEAFRILCIVIVNLLGGPNSIGIFVSPAVFWAVLHQTFLAAFAQSGGILFLITIVLYGLTVVFLKGLNNPEEYGFICSSYVSKCYESLGIKILPDKRSFIMPKIGDLPYKFFLERNTPADERGFIVPKNFANDPEIEFLYEINIVRKDQH